LNLHRIRFCLRRKPDSAVAEWVAGGEREKTTMGREPCLVGIAGPSCAGKSALARGVARALDPGVVTRVSIDAYYRELTGLGPDERAARDFDHPDALDHALLGEQLAEIARGRAVLAPVYDFATHSRVAERRTIRPSAVVIVEGLFALHWPEIRALLRLACYVDAPHEVCLARRVERDVRRRGRSADRVRERYERSVRPMCERFVRPTRRYADLVLDGTGALDEAVRTVIRELGLPDATSGS
jgi:uridine kinase